MHEYWDSPEGMRHRHLHRWMRQAFVHVSGEPTARSARGRRRAAPFRDAARGKIARHREWPRPRATLAVDVHFTTAHKTPPHIHKLAKNYLDLLGADDNGDPVLYRDDSQIKLLNVFCNHRWDPDEPAREGSVFVQARTRSEAIADMALAHQAELALDADDPLDDDPPPEPSPEPPEPPDPACPVERRAAIDLHTARLGAIQQQVLHASDQLLTHALWTDGRRLLTGTPPTRTRPDDPLAADLERHRAWRRASLLHGPLAVVLPPPPSFDRRSQGFRDDVADACRTFVARHPAMSPLVEPLAVTLLVIPPDDDQPRDLDNLAYDVVPAVNAHLQPPQEPWLQALDQLTPADLVDDDTDRHRRDLARLKSVVEYSVWSYRVVELHREPSDPPEGVLSMLLGRGDRHHSPWTLADDHLERVLDPLSRWRDRW